MRKPCNSDSGDANSSHSIGLCKARGCTSTKRWRQSLSAAGPFSCTGMSPPGGADMDLFLKDSLFLRLVLPRPVVY